MGHEGCGVEECSNLVRNVSRDWWKREVVQNNSQGPVVEMSSGQNTPLGSAGNQHRQELLWEATFPCKDSQDPILIRTLYRARNDL